LITREFLEEQIKEQETESEKARTFLIQSETSIALFRMLLSKLDEPDIKE